MTVRAYVIAEGPRAGVVVLNDEGALLGSSRIDATPLSSNCALVLGIERAIDLAPAQGDVLVIHLQNADIVAALAGEKPCKGTLADLIARAAARLGDFVIPHFDLAPSVGYDFARELASRDSEGA